MKKTTNVKIVLLTICLSLSIGNIALASGNTSVIQNEPAVKKDQLKTQDHAKCKRKHNHFLHSSLAILKNKHGLTAEEIDKAKASGKTVYDLAKAKGVSVEDLKVSMLAPKLKAIDEMVGTGELTQEKADAMKNKLKENLDAWDGKIEDMYTGKKTKNKPLQFKIEKSS